MKISFFKWKAEVKIISLHRRQNLLRPVAPSVVILRIGISLKAIYYMLFENLFNKFPWDIFQGKYGMWQKICKITGKLT